MSKIIYIAGPMSGIPQFNYPAFDEAAAYLRERGYTVLCPSEMDAPAVREAALASPEGNFTEFYEQLEGTGHRKETWGDFLSRDVKRVADEIDSVCLLSGWEESRGARLEAYVALTVQKPVSVLLDGMLCRLTPRELMGIITENTVDQGDVSRYED